MPIPSLTTHGALPEGIHDCSLEELKNTFGAFQMSDRRPELFQRLDQFLRGLATAEIHGFLIVNGSFVTDERQPDDIDLILVLGSNWRFDADLTPSEYSVLSRKRVRRLWGLDLLVAREGSTEYAEYVALFQRRRYRRDQRKGLLRLKV